MGESIRTWSDRWVPSIPSGKLQASYLAAIEYDPYQRVSQLVDREIRCLNLDPIIDHLFEEEITAINSFPLSSEWEENKLTWPFEKSGNYTVRSGYQKIHEITSNPSQQHSRWPQKVLHFLMANLFAKKESHFISDVPHMSSFPETICIYHRGYIWFDLPLNYISISLCG